MTRPARDTVSQQAAPSLRIQGTWENRPARDREGPLSHPVPARFDSDQAGLEDSDRGRRVTPARSCPKFPRFALPAQQLPARGRRVTPPRKLPGQTPPGGAADGTPAAAAAPRPESPAGLSRGGHTPCACAVPDDTPASRSSGSLQLIDGAETTPGRTDTASASSSSLSPSTGVWTTARIPDPPALPRRQTGHEGWVYSREQTWVISRKRLRVPNTGPDTAFRNTGARPVERPPEK